MFFAGFNFEFDLVCKYFSGAKDGRFGDIQSLRPVSQIPESIPGIFTVSVLNNFVNLSLEDKYIWCRLYRFASDPILRMQNSQVEIDFAGDVSSTEYRLFVFNTCVNEIWPPIISCCDDENNNQQLRRLSVMAIYLIEKTNNENKKDPQERESFKKLFDIFSIELYNTLTAGVLKDASPLLKQLTICALKLSINIRAYREA